MGVVGLAENKATQPSLAGAWAELGNSCLVLFNPHHTIILKYVRFSKLMKNVVEMSDIIRQGKYVD